MQAAKAQLAELEARLLAHADRIEVAAATAATSTANWHAHTTQTTRAQAHRAMRLAQGLEDHDPTRTALAEGRIHVEQAEAILRALTELPADLDPKLLAQAEQHLLDLATQYDAKALKHLGQHILEVACPDAADAHQAMLLEREERAAAAADPADHLGRRARQGPRQVHPRHPHRRDAQETPVRTRRPQTPRLPRTRSANDGPLPNGSARRSSS